ncbi:MAG TPA: FHA domain-containing protein [Thermoanaerobaculia bacterium]|nr:FHA domain-containing protein [Thermoanaerobaculia bacterium]
MQGGKIGESGLLLLAGMLVPLAVAASELHVGPVFTERSPTLEVVVEGHASPAAGGTLPAPADLILVEDGRATVPAQSVRPFSQTSRGLAVVVAVDASGSMAGAPMAGVKRALLALLQESGPQDRVALVSFADDVRVDSPFGASAAEFKAVVERLAPRGHITELYKGVFKSLELFTPGLPERRRLVVVSDGRDEGVAYKLDDVIEKARQGEVPVDAVGLTRIDPKYLSNLERLADRTGGSYARATETSLTEVVRTGMVRVRATPVATFTARSLTGDGRPHKLGVQWRQGNRWLQGETMVDLPVASPSAPPGGGAQSSTKKGRLAASGWERQSLWLYGGAAALILLAAALLIWRLRRARRAKARPVPGVRPSPAPASPQPLPLMAAQPASRPAVDPLSATPAAAPEPAVQPAETPAPAEEPPVPSPASRRKTQFRRELSAPRPGHPTVVLAVEEGSAAGERFAVESEPFWIGSAEGNDVQIPEDAHLSGNHASLRFHEGTLLLYDNQSTNGTFVNGERLSDVPAIIGPGDRIRTGRSTFVVLAP